VTLADARAQFRAALKGNADFFYPTSGSWSDGTSTRFKVTDPNAGKEARQNVLDQERASLRLVKFEPDQPVPAQGSSFIWERGQLYLGPPTDTPNLSGVLTYTCRQVDGRYFPQVLQLANGTQWLARIEALSARPGQVESGNDLVSVPGNSHRLTLPPGVLLDPGTEVTTSNADRYLVVPPVQRGVLGDVLGLSWQGPPQIGIDPTPDPVPMPGAPVETPGSPGDPFWHEPHTL